eukprot:g14434.t1
MKEGEDRRSKLAELEMKVAGSMHHQNLELEKKRRICLQHWNEMLDLKKQKDKAMTIGKGNSKPDLDKGEKIQKKIAKLKTKARDSFAVYEQAQTQLEEAATEFRTKTYPEVLQKYEQIERERLALVRNQLGLLDQLLLDFESPFSSIASLQTLTETLSVDKDMDSCIKSWISSYGKPPPDTAYTHSLPCASNDFLTNDWELTAKSQQDSRVGGAGYNQSMQPQEQMLSSLGSVSGASAFSSQPQSPVAKDTMLDTPTDDTLTGEGESVSVFPAAEEWVYALEDYIPPKDATDHLPFAESS